MRHGSPLDPPNRFESVQRERDVEQLAATPEDAADYLAQLENRRIEYLPDDAQSIVSENESPDIPFRYSLNPYRGCAHGCAYCYARPTHEYLGLNAGLDFETKVLVKHRAAELFREFLCRPAWRGELIVFSGVTDCYQPAEREYELTRRCLQVAAEARQPISIVTKNALVTRDLDVLQEMAARNTVEVHLSITTLDAELARVLEPRTSTPAARLRAVRELSEAGVPVGVMAAPMIPGLNDTELPAILAAAAQAGAKTAGYILIRLPLTVRPIFQDWLQRNRPAQQQRIESLLRACRDGELTSSQFGQRMRGTGPVADQLAQLFAVFRKKHHLDHPLPPLDQTQFRPPKSVTGQQWLF